METLINRLQPGICFVRDYPKWGRQDFGISPAGAMDLFAMRSANLLLGNNEQEPVLEIVLPPLLEFKQETLFVITGGHFGATLEYQDEKVKVDHGVVYLASKGSKLCFGARGKGFRSYLALRPLSKVTDSKKLIKKIVGRKRGDFDQRFSWADTEGAIRVIEGPEYSYLKEPQLFLSTAWKIGLDSNEMGMRLESNQSIEIEMENMISDAVADGTIQLTANGPIILLKHRQTVGGYPRIYNVISCDVDLLGQFMPGQIIHFKKISLEQAQQNAILKESQLQKLAF